MPRVRIFKPAKPATQSGAANTRQWVLEFEPAERKERERLMGWTASRDTRRQVQLRFATLDEAIAYAEKRGLDFVVEKMHERRVRPKSYADNFRPDRDTNWTH
jgi:ETC complex I subunit conserved region